MTFIKHLHEIANDPNTTIDVINSTLLNCAQDHIDRENGLLPDVVIDPTIYERLQKETASLSDTVLLGTVSTEELGALLSHTSEDDNIIMKADVIFTAYALGFLRCMHFMAKLRNDNAK